MRVCRVGFRMLRRWALTILAPLILPVFFAAVCICALARRRNRDGDCLIVLGAKVRADGGLSQTLRLRCETALRLWKRGGWAGMILCGGRLPGEPYSEARAMRDFLTEGGVDADALILEDTSCNTVENLKNALVILRNRGWRRAAMVTSDYHLTRALWIARDLGMEVCGAAAPSPGGFRSFMLNRMREAASWLLYFRRKWT